MVSLRNSLFSVVAMLAFSAQARDFRSADVHPADYPTVEAVKHVDKVLKEQTQKRLDCALGLNTPPVGTTQFIGCAIGGVSVAR